MDQPGIEQAWAAVAREAWSEAYALLRELADPDHPHADLAPSDLDALADAAW